jgi:hypothetical protein
MFLDFIWVDRFRMECQQVLPKFNFLLIFSWIKLFWFINVIPKYLNTATFSNDLLVIFGVSYSFCIFLYGIYVIPYQSYIASIGQQQVSNLISEPSWKT